MPFDGNNTTLFPSYNGANQIDLGTDNINNNYVGTAGADAFIFHSAASGGDSITGFGNNDTLIADHAIFDGNGDGYIDFGSNLVLDVDRTGSGNSKAGDYKVAVQGTGDDNILTIRYLGSKDGGFVYASAETRDQLLGHFKKGMDSTAGYTGGDSSLAGIQVRYDNSVATDTYNVGNQSAAILFDNALGLNFGGDTINGFGSDDLLVFTAKIYDGDKDNIIHFDKNKVLDVSAQAPDPRDPVYAAGGDSVGAPGGQLDINNPNVLSIKYLGQKTIGDSTYYYYGSLDHVGTPTGVAIV